VAAWHPASSFLPGQPNYTGGPSKIKAFSEKHKLQAHKTMSDET